MDVFTLWLPILAAGVAVFIASFLAWAVLPHHRKDWRKLDDEAGFYEALGSLGIGLGHYMFPYCASAEEMKSEAFRQRWEKGPCGTLTVWSGGAGMGKQLALTLLVHLAVSAVIGWLASVALSPGAPFGEVCRFCAVAATLAHTAASLPNAIWFRKKGRAVLNDFMDGVAYGLVTGVVFAALWPAT